MANDVLPDSVETLAGLISTDGDEIVARMDERADRDGFPTVGPAVGGWLELFARMTNAKRVFEFGSGFGYSAYWFARGLPDDGEIVLTEIDADELELAREYFADGNVTVQARFEHGDAIDIVDEYDGPFDIVLIDNEKHRYCEALQAIEEKLKPGSLVLADNAITAGPIDHEQVVSLLSEQDATVTLSDLGDELEINQATEGIAEYLEYVRTHEQLQTVLLPLGEGLAVSLVR